MSFTPKRLGAVIAVAALASVMFAGCVQQAEKRESTPFPQQQAEASATPAPKAGQGAPDVDVTQPVGTQLPELCSELLPEPSVKAADPRIEVFDTSADLVIERMRHEVGPLTMATLEDGEQQRYCSFGIRQTDGGGSLGVAVIGTEKKSNLLEALRSSVYEEIEPGAAEAAFYRGPSAEHRLTAEILLDGDVLVVVPHTIGGNYAWDALAVIQARRDGAASSG